MALSVLSSAFREGETIPVRYTCEGADVSPPLRWGDLPAETKSLAMIMDDPDAPGRVFTHWVLFNLAANIRELSEGVPTAARLPDGSLQGKNDFGKVGYGGPCPPPGKPHRYQFTVYALKQSLDLKSGATKQQVLDAMKGQILAQGTLTGIFRR